jgi:hypothetical protein
VLSFAETSFSSMYDTAPRLKIALLVDDVEEQAARNRRLVRRESSSRFMKGRTDSEKSVITAIPQRRGAGVARQSTQNGDSTLI